MERRRIESMANPMMSVDDVAKILAYSKSHAYKVIGRLNEELEKKGFLTRTKEVLF